jgi:hypothetical protein
MRSALHRPTLLMTIAVAVLAVGYSGIYALTRQPATAESSGPMTSLAGSGRVSVHVPQRRPETWVATFGAMVCVPRGARARITDVDYDIGVRPLNVRTRVRQVDNRHRPDPVDGLASKVGTSKTLPGRLTRLADQPVVGVACSSDKRFAEVLTELRTGPTGAQVDGFTVTYLTAGQTYTLDVDWLYAACGTEIKNMGCRNR